MKKVSLLLVFLMLLGIQVTIAQTRDVSGVVTSADDGSTIPGASIVVKGTTVGTVTDMDGRFTLKIPSGAKNLTISFVGFAATDVAITDAKAYKIVLQSERVAVDEVVVVAFGTAKKSSLTGAITSVNAASLEKRPVTNVLSALSGTAAGVQVNTSYGQPGSDPTIRIRGFGSVNYSSEPLIVLDGSPFNGVMANINPSDIETINFLKDAASTALYGARGSNGVIMITTKKGKKEKLSINTTISQGVSGRGLPEYDRIDGFQYYPIMWESLRNSLVTATRPIDQASILASGATSNGIVSQLGYNPFKGVANDQVVGTDGKLNPAANTMLWDDTDWYSPVEQLGNRTDATVTANGGSEMVDYYLSAGYTSDHGWIKKTDYERITARGNINVTPKKWLTFGANISASYTPSHSANTESNTGYANPVYFARTMGPIYPVYLHNRATGDYLLDAMGERQWDIGGQVIQDGITYGARAQNNGRHGIAEHMLNDRSFERNTVQSRVYSEFSFLKDFKFRLSNSIDINNAYSGRYENTKVGDGAPSGRSTRTNSVRYTITNSQILTYNKSFGKHEVKVMAGHEAYKNQYKELYGFRQGQVIPDNSELINFTTTNSLSSYVDNHRTEGFISRATYGYENGKYTFETSFRRDGSSKFENQVRWGNFYSFGGGWKINSESFLSDVKWVDLLKLRASYGLNGNDGGISYYAWQVLYNYNFNAAEPGYIQSTVPGNPALQWETTAQTDVGVEFSIFNNLLRGTVDWYNKESRDLIFAVPLAPTTGYTSQNRNIGKLFNRGFEVDLTAQIVKSKNFSFNLNVIAATNKNQITELPEKNREKGIISGSYKRVEGGSIYDYWLRQWYGVDPANGDALYLFDEALVWADTDCKTMADGQKVTSNQAKAKYDWAGTSMPDVFGSVTPSFNVYGFDISMQFNYSIGGKSYDNNWASLMSTGGMGSAKSVDILDRWTTPGQITNVPRMDNSKTTNFNAASSRWLLSSTYYSLRNINISYSFKPNVLKKLDMNALRVYLSAENLALISSKKGLDPTQNFSGSVLNDVGFNRILTLGVNVNF
jgi:TonB-linked SusC/RagA family outer membrane protein